MRIVSLSWKIPFYTQRINFDDPLLEGFKSRKEAEYWQPRGCGIACLRMIVDGLSPTHSQIQYGALVQIGLEQQAYCDRGWIHTGLVKLARSSGVSGRAVRKASVEDIIAELEADRPCIASVSVCFRGGERGKDGEPTKPGGHLVVVLGAQLGPDGVEGLVVHHPSSNPLYDWPNRLIPIEKFTPSFSRSYMAFWPSHARSSWFG